MPLLKLGVLVEEGTLESCEPGLGSIELFSVERAHGGDLAFELVLELLELEFKLRLERV